MRYYCTLFDSNYFSRGIALYNSLVEHSSQDFILYVLAMDEKCFLDLKNLNLPKVKVISLRDEFVSGPLVELIDNRAWNEFCWTCSSALIKYCFEKFQTERVTYLDADIYFFNDPEIIQKELTDNDSVLITEHNYAQEHDQEKTSGKFCVQFVSFNRNKEGLDILEDWYSKCLESCELNPKKGLCGDQKYLDEWPQKFSRVIISKKLGAGLAPWNLSKFNYKYNNDKLCLRFEGAFEPVVFFHFHALKIDINGNVTLSGPRYYISKLIYSNVYKKYLFELSEIASKLLESSVITFHGAQPGSQVTYGFKKSIKKALKKLLAARKYNFNQTTFMPSLVLKTCPVCEEKTEQIKYDSLYDDRYGYPGYFMLGKCRACQHKFLINNLDDSDLVNLYSNYYPRSKFSVDDFDITKFQSGMKGWLDGEKSSAVAWIPKNTSVLDIGCGFGQSIAYHKERGCRVVGVEADENAQRVAQKYNLDIRAGVFDLKLFEENEIFDYITFDQVLEHSLSPVKFLADVKKVLSADGKIILTIPNANGWGAKLFGRKWINWHTPYHLHFFSKKSLEIVASRNNFEIVSFKTVTHSNWLFYQLIHYFQVPKLGSPSSFWNDGKSKIPYKMMLVFKVFKKLYILSFITRFFDLLKLGDNAVIELRERS